MKHLLLVAAVAALTACGGGGGGGSSGGFALGAAALGAPASKAPDPAKAPDSAPARCSVEFWGDSISAMTAPRLGTGLQVVLHGVVGGTAQAALPALLQAPLNTSFVAFEYGTNDANGNDPSYPIAMRSMLERVRSLNGPRAVVVGLSNATAGNMALRANYNAVAASLAKEFGAVFVDWAAVPWSAGDLMPDRVHPAEAYQQRLADEMTAAIMKECER